MIQEESEGRAGSDPKRSIAAAVKGGLFFPNQMRFMGV
jgi:hypothetical protein